MDVSSFLYQCYKIEKFNPKFNYTIHPSVLCIPIINKFLLQSSPVKEFLLFASKPNTFNIMSFYIILDLWNV